MHQDNSCGDTTDTIIQTLSGLLDRGLLDKGEQGGLVARLLLTLAYDAAIQREQSELTVPNYSKGVSVISFIEALFPQTVVEDILDSCPNNNVKDETAFRDAFSMRRSGSHTLGRWRTWPGRRHSRLTELSSGVWRSCVATGSELWTSSSPLCSMDPRWWRSPE